MLLALLLGGPVIAGGPPDAVNGWPLFYYEKGAAGSRLDVLGPLFSYEKSSDGTAFGVRPLFDWRRETEAKKTTWRVLYPLSYFRKEPEATRQFFFPFYFHYWRVAPNGKPASASVIFPFAWWGESPTLGKWWYIVLVGGTFKGMFGADEISYWSIAYLKSRTGDTVTRHYMWPFVSIQRGPDRHGIRIWPFYGYHERKDRWWNGYVLWPFFTYGAREASEGKDAARYFQVFPFYGQSRSRDGKSGSTQVLWPLFYRAWNSKTGYREWKLPYPLVTGSRSKDAVTTNVWPFWGTRRWKGGSENFVLGPLVYWATVRARNQRRDELRVFPFFTHLSRTEPKNDLRYSYWLFWPLWRSRTTEQKGTPQREANAFQFAFVRDSEEFDRTYNPLLGFYEHETRRDGRRSTFLLWRFYRSESGPGWRSVQLGPLASWRSGEGLTRTSVLLGLVQTGTREGRRGWRVLGLPFGASLRPPRRPPAEGPARGAP